MHKEAKEKILILNNMIGEEYIQPEIEETPALIESPEATEIAGGPGTKGDRRLSQIAKLLNSAFPERYKNIDEKWLKDFVSKSDDNARQIFLSVSSTGKAKNLPTDQNQFRDMLLDKSPDVPKPAQPAQVEQPAPEAQPLPQEAQQEVSEEPAPAPAPATTTATTTVPEQKPAPTPAPAQTPTPEQPEEPGFFQKVWQGLGNMALPNLQTAQTVSNIWDRMTGKADAKVQKPVATDAQKLQNYEKQIAAFRPIDDEKKRYEESRKTATTGRVGDIGERAAMGAMALTGTQKEQENIPVSPESKALLEKHKKAEEEYNLALKESAPAIEKIAQDAVKKHGLDKFFQYNFGTKHTGFNIAEIDRVAKSAAKAAGVPENGYAYSLIKSRIQGIASFQKNVAPELAKKKTEIEAKIADAYGKLKKVKNAKTGKITAANLQTDIQADFTKKFTEAEVIKAKATQQQIAIGQEIKEEGKAEVKTLNDAYQADFKKIQDKAYSDPEVINFQQNLEGQDRDRLQNMVNQNQITVEKANEILKNPERIKKISEQTTQFALKKFGGEFGKAWQDYSNSVNQLNSRKQAKYQRMKDEIVKSAEGELKTAFDQFKTKYKMDPALESLVQTISQDVYKEEINNILEGKEKEKFKQDQSSGFISNMIDQTMSNLGASLKNFGVIFGSDGLKGFGDIIENNYKLGEYKNDSWADLFDPTKMAGNTGMLLGRMAPGILTAAGLTAATRGAGLPQATQIMAATLGSWGAETIDMVGGMYNDVLEESGDPIKAKDAANKLIQGQIAMIPTYTFEVLPFFNVMKGSTLTKALKGGSLEYITEGVFQEFPQNAMEEAIKKNDEFYNAYKYMNYEKFRETMVATAPSFFFGGAPAAFKGARDYTAKAMAEREAKSFLAKQSLLFNELNMSQSFIDIQRQRGKNFTGALVSNLYTGGQLTKEQADALAIQVENFEKFSAFAKKNNLDYNQQKVSFVLFNELEKAEKDGRIEDANKYKGLIRDLFDNNKLNAAPDLHIVALPNGDEYFYTHDQVLKLFENDNFRKMIRSGDIAIGSWYNDKKAPEREEVRNLYEKAIKEKDQAVTDTEVLVDDDEYARFKNENKVDEERMLAFIDDYLNDVDFSKIPDVDQRYVEMYNHFLPEIKRRAGEEEVEYESPEIAEIEKRRKEELANPFGGGTDKEYFDTLVKYGIGKGKMDTPEILQKNLEDAINAKYDAEIAALKAKPDVVIAEGTGAVVAEEVKPTITAGQQVVVNGERGVVIDEGEGKFAIQVGNKIIEIPDGQGLESVNAKVFTAPVQGQTPVERLKSKLQQKKDASKNKVQVIDENTAMVDGKKFRINKDPKGNAIYLTDGKIEIRDENVLIDVDIQRHKLEVKETPEEQERQLQELYSELPVNRRTAVQFIVEKDMTDRIANLLENGITDQTDDTDFLQTRLWAEGRIAELREKESDNSYALDMIEELQNLLNTLWYEHYQKFGKEPGAASAGQVEQGDTGKKEGPGIQDTSKERLVANVGDELHDAIGEFGEGVDSKMDAEKRLADGEILFGFNEQDDSLTELFNEDLGAWPADTIIAIRPEYLPGAKEEVTTEKGEGKEQKEFDIDEKIRLIKEQGKPLSEFKVGDKVFWASDSDPRFKQYVEGKIVRISTNMKEVRIERFDENPMSKRFKIAELRFADKAMAKPEGEAVYTGEETLWNKKQPEAAETEQTEETPWTELDKALETTGKQGETMRAELKAKLGDEVFNQMRKIAKDFEKIVDRLETDKKIKKDCP